MAIFVTTMEVKIEAGTISDVDDLSLSTALWEWCDENGVKIVSIQGFGVSEVGEV